MFRTYPDPSALSCFANHYLVSNYFLLKTLRFREKHHHLLILLRVFVPHIGLSLHILGKCVGYGCNHSHFSTRREKLVSKRKLA